MYQTTHAWLRIEQVPGSYSKTEEKMRIRGGMHIRANMKHISLN